MTSRRLSKTATLATIVSVSACSLLIDTNPDGIIDPSGGSAGVSGASMLNKGGAAQSGGGSTATEDSRTTDGVVVALSSSINGSGGSSTSTSSGGVGGGVVSATSVPSGGAIGGIATGADTRGGAEITSLVASSGGANVGGSVGTVVPTFGGKVGESGASGIIGVIGQAGAAAGAKGDCTAGDVRACSTYPFAPAIPDSTKCKNGSACTSPCKNGKQTCVTSQGGGTEWGLCNGAIEPRSADSCESGNDGNCNGVANEGCICTNGSTEACSSALSAKGNCASGKATCENGAWGACSIKPAASDNCAVVGDDANCNGLANDTCPCTPGETGTCAAKLSAKGACATGTATCNGQGTGWVCSVQPAVRDACDQGNDSNCNGKANDGCLCVDGTKASCATALGAKGTCANGNVTCSGGIWGACSIQPKNDTCDSGNDDSCDGTVNTPPGGCACMNGSQKSCGACGDGVSTCIAGGWGPCQQPAQSTWYRDVDNDGYGDPTSTMSCSTRPTGYVAGSGDCCDSATDLATAAKIHPGADFQTVAANVCGITFDYNCSGILEKDRQMRSDCTAYPDCSTIRVDFPDNECGQSHSNCGCSTGSGACLIGCGSAAILGCK